MFGSFTKNLVRTSQFPTYISVALAKKPS